jgi:signal transduction histidine kinase
MNLKRRFSIMVAGSILVPFLTAFILAILLNSPLGGAARGEIPNPAALIRAVEESRSLEELQSTAASLPPNLGMVILDGEGRTVSKSSMTDVLVESGKQFQQLMVLHPKIVDESAAASWRVFIIGRRNAAIAPIMLTAVISIPFLFMLILSVSTIRSIRTSLGSFEIATKKIADGDMNFSLDIPKGDTFGSLAASFEKMRERVREEYDRRTRFFMGVSHDLKTPLASITGYTDALLEGLAEDEETRNGYLRIIGDKAGLLQSRIGRLMEYIRLANRDFQSRMERLPFLPFLEDFFALEKEEAAFTGRTMEVDIDLPGNPRLLFDPDLLHRALENLLRNAFIHGDETQPVRIRVRHEGGEIHIQFANSVHAAPDPEMLKWIFDPFFRGDTSRRGDGFGLGLASVKSIVESHGWSVEVSAAKEMEMHFTIRIPEKGAEA